MKNLLLIVMAMSGLFSCSQSHDMTGEYERISKSGSVQYLLKLHPNGIFSFDSYGFRQIEGKNTQIKGNMPTEPSMSGRGKWRAENDIVHFVTDRDVDVDHNYPLNLDNTKARFKNPSDEKAMAELEFLESEVFWISGIELKKRSQE